MLFNAQLITILPQLSVKYLVYPSYLNKDTTVSVSYIFLLGFFNIFYTLLTCYRNRRLASGSGLASVLPSEAILSPRVLYKWKLAGES